LLNLSGEGLDNLDDLNEALPEEEEAAKEDDDLDFNDDSFADKKKKKKKKKVNVDDLDDGDADKENEGEGDSADPWTGSDRDYLYDELLQVNTSSALHFQKVELSTDSFAFRECLEL